MPKTKKRTVYCDCGAPVSIGSVFCSECKKKTMEKNQKVLNTSSPMPDLFAMVRRG